MNKRFKKILSAVGISLLVISIMYFTDKYYPDWIVPVMLICGLGVIIWTIVRMRASYEENENYEQLDMFSQILPTKYKKNGKVFVLIFSIFIFSIFPLLINSVTNLPSRIEKEVIIKKYNANNQLLEQKSYIDTSIGWDKALFIFTIAIVFIISVLKQSKTDDERIKMIRYMAYRESFILALLSIILISMINIPYYVSSKIFYAYIIIVCTFFQLRLKAWADKM